MQKWLGYAESHSPSGMLERWPDTDYRNWYLGDWAVPDGIDQTDTASVNLVNNCFMAVCYGTMEKISELLGNESDASLYRKKNEALRAQRTFTQADRRSTSPIPFSQVSFPTHLPERSGSNFTGSFLRITEVILPAGWSAFRSLPNGQ